MATAFSLITRAMRLSGAIGSGEAPDDDESADGLDALNTMLESWSIERLSVPYIVEETLTMVPSTSAYTMGSSGDLNTDRPTRVEDSCFIRYADIDTPLTLLNYEGYAAIVDKTTQSNVPEYLFVDMRNPLVYLTFWPVPSSASAVAHIFSWKQLQQFSELTTVLALAPGYKRAIEYNLAIEYDPEFGEGGLTPQMWDKVNRIAVRSLANIQRINAPSPIMRSEAWVLTRRRPVGNIYSG